VSKTITIRTVVALACLVGLGCVSHELEENFFKQPLASRVERLRQYGLADQYKIFRYGNDVKEPPLMDLANPIAERGAAAVPFLADKLNADSDDVAVRDILTIFERMAVSGSYNVKSDAALMGVLTSKVAGIKDKGWQDTCLKKLQRIRNSR
jgi:hypothetical protein